MEHADERLVEIRDLHFAYGRRPVLRGVTLDIPRGKVVAILGTSGDEAIHGVIDIMNADVPLDVLRWAVPIHPTVSELLPTLLVDLKPAAS